MGCVFSAEKTVDAELQEFEDESRSKMQQPFGLGFFFFFPPSVEESELSVDPCISPTTVFLFFYHSTFVFFLSFQTPFHPLQKVSAFFFCPAVWVRLGAYGSCFCRKGHGGCCLATACLILDVPVEQVKSPPPCLFLI